MIRFFRKIRKGITFSGGIKKYFFYAVGEILLVMIGILLALQVNNWNENRKDRKKEKELMNAVSEEFKLDSMQMDRMLTTIKDKAEQASRIIDFLSRGQDKIDTAETLSNIYLIGRFIQYEPSLPTFDEILSSGQSTLIRSRIFKEEIKKYLKICDFHEAFLYQEGRENKELYNRHVHKYFDARIFSDFWVDGNINMDRLKNKFNKRNLLLDFEGFHSDPESLYYTRQVAGTDEELYAILNIVKTTFLSPALGKLREEIQILE